MKKVRFFSISRYVEAALTQAEYERDENDVVIATVPEASGFFAQGDNFEEARLNLRDVIEGMLREFDGRLEKLATLSIAA